MEAREREQTAGGKKRPLLMSGFGGHLDSPTDDDE